MKLKGLISVVFSVIIFSVVAVEALSEEKTDAITAKPSSAGQLSSEDLKLIEMSQTIRLIRAMGNMTGKSRLINRYWRLSLSSMGRTITRLLTAITTSRWPVCKRGTIARQSIIL